MYQAGGVAAALGQGGGGGVSLGLKFTNHGLIQATGRDGGLGVAWWALRDALANPLQTIPQSGGRLKIIGQYAVVVINSAGEIITCWARTSEAYYQ